MSGEHDEARWVWGWREHHRQRLRELPCGENFPTRDQLWWGAVARRLIEAVSLEYQWTVTAGPTFAMFVDAERGAITFAGDAVVGMFFHNWLRSPWPSYKPPYDARPYLAGMPDDLRDIANRYTFPAMMEWGDDLSVADLPSRLAAPPEEMGLPVERRIDEDGTLFVGFPVITSAFWGVGDHLTAAEPWLDVFSFGASLLDHFGLLDGLKQALAVQSGHDWASWPERADFVRGMYARMRSGEAIRLTESEWQTILAWAEKEWSPLERPLSPDHVRGLLTAIGIGVP